MPELLQVHVLHSLNEWGSFKVNLLSSLKFFKETWQYLQNNIQNNSENEKPSTREIFRVDKVDGVPNESDNVATFRKIRREGTFLSKKFLNVP